jgi:rubrerythrin
MREISGRKEKIPAMTSGEKIEGTIDPKISWRCTVCGFVYTGEKPPKGCPVCHSPSHEFIQETTGPGSPMMASHLMSC